LTLQLFRAIDNLPEGLEGPEYNRDRGRSPWHHRLTVVGVQDSLPIDGPAPAKKPADQRASGSDPL